MCIALHRNGKHSQDCLSEISVHKVQDMNQLENQNNVMSTSRTSHLTESLLILKKFYSSFKTFFFV